MLEFTDMSISDNTTTTHHIMVAAVESSMPMVAQETRDPESKDGLPPDKISIAVPFTLVGILACVGVIIWYLRRQRRARSAAAGQDPAGHGAGANGNVELHELPRQRGQQEGHDVAEE